MPKNLLILLLSFSLNFFAQTNGDEIPIGTWRDHLPYNDAISITTAGDLIYCATNSAIYYYNKSDGSVDRLNLVNGLSDIGISKIKHTPNNNKLIVAYTNGNLDIVTNNTITNLSFIKQSNIIGNKSIHHIFLEGNIAYLSTGFGIVVLNIEKEEFVETYFFGPSGNSINTNSVTTDETNIYAATDEGIYFAKKANRNLIDYNEWKPVENLIVQKYNSIVNFSGMLFASSDSPNWESDTIYYKNKDTWEKFLPNSFNINAINTSKNNLFINFHNSIQHYDTSLNLTNTITNFKSLFSISPKQTYLDNEDYLIIADEKHGLLRMKTNWDAYNITINSPNSKNTYQLDLKDGDLWMVSGGIDPNTFEPIFLQKNLVNFRQDGEWKNLGEEIKNLNKQNTKDAVSIAIDPSNKSKAYFGTWDDGLFEVNNGNITSIFTAQNSLLDSTSFGTTKIGGLAFDKLNNLWVISGFSNTQIAVKDANNNWTSLPSIPETNNSNVFTSLIITEDNNKWLMNPKDNSIFVFNENEDLSGGLTNTFLTSSENNIPGTRLYCLTEDLDREVWIGTDEGIAVFYNAANVFSEEIRAEPIYVQQDGQTQKLLESEIINTIKVDGANRKWIGTQSSGVFLMSSNGTEEINHFTTENSPLFSNAIFDIEIDDITGEVYFATEKGLISYKGTATEGDTEFQDVLVYPNPVKPNFTGTIAIRGLMKDTDVKITDVSGNIVYQTTSLGGQAIWDGKDFNGNKVQSGVYLIFNGSPQGTLKAVAKILFIH